MTSLAQLALDASTCTRCPLAAGRTQVVFGVGDPAARLLFVGEGPGRDEDLEGEPFVGRSGQLLDRLLREELGLERSAIYIANVVKCRPPGNRDPRPEEVATCRPWLDSQIELIDPAVIVTLGNFATKLLLATTDGITRLRGHTYDVGGRNVVPTFHPSAALRSGGGEPLAQMRADFVRAKEILSGVQGPSGPLSGVPA
ncbi:MAG TPA: uracil-DNA glycosylase [Acidimicrobiales bacterium]|nr:uracil-DNA glycosylase [Acidimicrobiales bacterium]